MRCAWSHRTNVTEFRLQRCSAWCANLRGVICGRHRSLRNCRRVCGLSRDHHNGSLTRKHGFNFLEPLVHRACIHSNAKVEGKQHGRPGRGLGLMVGTGLHLPLKYPNPNRGRNWSRKAALGCWRQLWSLDAVRCDPNRIISSRRRRFPLSGVPMWPR